MDTVNVDMFQVRLYLVSARPRDDAGVLRDGLIRGELGA